ncbi:hypothetical protein [Fulvimarina sp. MAC3]|uniref:hypothetical protein n=1 Tax=Fulvimarina sp. MAC3 TaxID=3148887 RepID=UPI0031FCC2B2
MRNDFETWAERTRLFSSEKSTARDDFAGELEWLVRRIKLLHWAMDVLANSEFRTDQDNEWLWNFSQVAFDIILSDTKRAHQMSRRVAGKELPSPMQLTLDALRAVMFDELKAQGIKAGEINARIEAKIAVVAEAAKRQIAEHYPDEAA